MKFSYRSYVLTSLYFVLAAYFFVTLRFVGLSSIPAFSSLDYESLDIGFFFIQATIIGLMIGAVFYFLTQAFDAPIIRNRRYAVVLVLQLGSNMICVCLALTAIVAFNSLVGNNPFTLSTLESRLVSINFLVTLAYYVFVSTLFFLFRQIDQKCGPGNLLKIVKGTFYHPREVEMIVMFMDLNDSTTHAERLGHLEFGQFIQDCIADMAVVADFKAQFYQYVGDEAVLLWEVADGTEESNCLRAYFAFKSQLETRRNYYESKYGVFPQFKAGTNIGYVTVLEIGTIKREIAYLGDVLNTAARIRDQCGIFQEPLLISEMLVKRLVSVSNNFALSRIGMAELKGRAETVQLFGVKERSHAELHKQ